MTSALEDQREAVIDVKISAFIPNDYIPQVSQKIAVYQQLAKARAESEVEDIAAVVDATYTNTGEAFSVLGHSQGEPKARP